MSYQNVKDFRQRLKTRAVYVLGDKCQCCGYDKCIQALDFHHLDPTQKDFSFSDNVNRSWEKIKEELKKCILVCANCHREIHAGLIDNTQLNSSYDKNRAQEIDILVENTKIHKIHYCKNCGVEIWAGSEYCPNCSAIQRRKVERPTRDELKKLIREKPFTKIAEEYEVTDNAIRKWCKSFSLPSKKSDIILYTDDEWNEL